MRITDEILNFASRHQTPFKKSNLLKSLTLAGMSESSINVQLNRMVSDGRLLRVGYATYSLPTDAKPEFIYTPSSKEIELSKLIKDKFPFVNYCIWNTSAIVKFMQHIPASEILLIDVERVAMESVFVFLQSISPNTHILLNPSAKECERYIVSETIIIRPLVNEAPIKNSDDCPTPSIEKILVDAIADKELQFLQGSELYRIFQNAFESVNISKSKLLRYASRRNRKEQAEKIIKTLSI